MILLLPNISFGQNYNTCSEFNKNVDTTITFTVGDSSYFTVQADEIPNEVVIKVAQSIDGFKGLILNKRT
jgi:uncharacterized FlaG/YvyC family protein